MSGCLILNWRRLPPGESGRLGLVTSRKVGGAVVRSHARRLMREAYRLQQAHVAVPLALVLVARPSMATRDLEGVSRDLRRCLREAGLWRDAVDGPAGVEASPPPAEGARNAAS